MLRMLSVDLDVANNRLDGGSRPEGERGRKMRLRSPIRAVRRVRCSDVPTWPAGTSCYPGKASSQIVRIRRSDSARAQRAKVKSPAEDPEGLKHSIGHRARDP